MKNSFLLKQNKVLAFRPLVVGTLTQAASLVSQIKTARASGIDVVEIRLDSFSKTKGPFQRVQEFGRNLIRDVKTKTNLPILLTLRAADEGGAFNPESRLDDRRRAEILARLLPSVEMVDVEIRHPEFARRMTVIGHIHGVDVIHSLHDFNGPGNLKTFDRLSALSKKLRGDVFKVAVTPKHADDLQDFMVWGKKLSNPYRVLIGMGPVGLVSRVGAYSFGSILTYGHLGRSAAPGQMPAHQLVKAIRDVYSAH